MQPQVTSIRTLNTRDPVFAPIFEGVSPAITELYYISDNLEDLLARPRVAIVGSRKVTTYGRQVTAQFAGELARQGVVIVSGLAYGVDAIAHEAALEAGGLTIAVLPGALSKIYPAGHTGLAQRIVEQGGALLSEYAPGRDIAYKNQFIERNRIVTGVANVLLITEATANSGTMHTARFALEQGKDVMAVPGNITSPLSEGTNNLIRTGAMLVLSPDDVLTELGLGMAPAVARVKGGSADEQTLIDLLSQNITDASRLLAESALPVSQFNQALTMMELTGKIRALGANQWALRS